VLLLNTRLRVLIKINCLGDVMSIVKRGNSYLVRVYLGRDTVTKKRIDINRTVYGTLAYAKKVEVKLKAKKDSESFTHTSQMTLNKMLDLYLDSVRHVQSKSTQHRHRNFLNYYVRPYIGHISLKKINTNIIQKLFNFLLDKEKNEGRT
jgi:hypothetical protein